MIDAIEAGKFPLTGFYTWNACKFCSFSHLCDKDTGLVRDADPTEAKGIRF